MNKHTWRLHPDRLAVLILILIWLVFFWRLITPVAADQASFKQGDFSGQFVAFGAYQYERFVSGEIPLWNPYNNAGLPFIADTQAAIFYPPRLLTIGLASLLGGWSYNALQLEAMAHVLAYSLMMYAFIRRLTIGKPASAFGAFTGAVVAAYGGYITGYPPLQLALLEAGVWLPLAALGILEATRTGQLRWRWLALTGFALGLSWMAGHPQTSFFLTYLLVAYYAYSVWAHRIGWRSFMSGTALFGLITVGVTAVTFLPGVEYLALATRADMGFEAKANGFPFQDIAQFALPGSVSLWSPLYVGLPALIFVFGAVRLKQAQSRFWLVIFGVGLLLSFGGGTVLYHLLYNIVPGLRFFRGQERAAFLVANSLAILAGSGACAIAAGLPNNRMSIDKAARLLRNGLLAITALIFLGWLGTSGQWFSETVGIAFRSALVAVALAYLLHKLLDEPQSRRWLALIGLLVVFELLSVNINSEGNYDPRRYTEQLSMTPPPLVQAALADTDGKVVRVDGFRGLQDNYGSLYQLMDMRGISPLFLAGPERIIYRNYVNNPLAWDLFAVGYVYSESESLSVPSDVIARGDDRDGPVFLHKLDDPRPFAHLVYSAEVLDSDEFAYALLDDARFDYRNNIILNQAPGLDLSGVPTDGGSAQVVSFSPESFTIDVSTDQNAVLSLAHPDYPGWQATLDGQPVELLRAYGALTAIPVPAGQHSITLSYQPLSYRIGAVLSLVTWAGLSILAIVLFIRRQ